MTVAAPGLPDLGDELLDAIEQDALATEGVRLPSVTVRQLVAMARRAPDPYVGSESDVLRAVVRIAGAPPAESLQSLLVLVDQSFADASVELVVSREDVAELAGAGNELSFQFSSGPGGVSVTAARMLGREARDRLEGFAYRNSHPSVDRRLHACAISAGLCELDGGARTEEAIPVLRLLSRAGFLEGAVRELLSVLVENSSPPLRVRPLFSGRADLSSNVSALERFLAISSSSTPLARAVRILLYGNHEADPLLDARLVLDEYAELEESGWRSADDRPEPIGIHIVALLDVLDCFSGTKALSRPAEPRRPIARGHLVDGEFQSDKYPTTPRGKVPLSVKDCSAQDLLWEYSRRRRPIDDEFSRDLEDALRGAGYDPTASGSRWPTDDLGVPELAEVDVGLARQGFHRIGRLDDAGRRSLWLRMEKDALELLAGREGKDASIRVTREDSLFRPLQDVLSDARLAAEWEDRMGQALDPGYLLDESSSSIHRIPGRLSDDRLDEIYCMIDRHRHSYPGLDRQEVVALVNEAMLGRRVRARARSR